MPTDLTFKEVCKFLKKDDSKIVEAADKLLGAAILFSPIAFGSQAVSALRLLGAKNELTKLGKELIEKVTSKKESDYLARMERMHVAYGLICITAFFEALEHLLPDDLRNKIALLPQEKISLTEQAGRRIASREEERNTSKILKEGVVDISLLFPHPIIPFEEQTANLSRMYKNMAIGFDEFIKKLAVWEEADEQTMACIRQTVEELPKTSLKCFEGQYLELARKYNDFCIWSRLHECKTTQTQLHGILNYLESYNSRLSENNEKIDIGFDKLQETVLSIPDQFRKIEAHDVVNGLKRFYEARINEPIIEDYKPDDGKPVLNFPKISEAFIPQSYRVLLQTKKDSHLEREETWKNIEPKHDLGLFLLSYLSSPYSIETPLLILGHPGSGKSLLTKVLCARLMSDIYTPVRVPLREVNADLPIEEQAEYIINRTTGHKLNSWAHFSNQFSDRPLVIILDGYDELLQASGKVYAGYLKQVQQFQKREAEQRRPVRVIVTSRITLIDKTTIPEGSTVLRLLEFNEAQRNAWIQVWNNANKDYFSSCNPPIEPFAIPENENKSKNDKILSLAEQPLLLLMLALYDSDENRLRQHRGIDRTVLYDSLLRRFVERERRRYVKDFEQLAQSLRDKEIDREMLRLGAVAIGMYNRRQLHILSSDLAADLKFFELERPITVEDGRSMTQADLLLGSFFFIHKSKAGQQGEEVHTETDTAFEFLHNTFGEFLTSAFILRFAFQEAEALYLFKNNESLQSELQRKINNPDGLAKEWFACLMYAPLYSRPVVLEMLREWITHLLEQKKRSREEFLSCLDEILKSQIGMLLKATNLPSMLRNDAKQFTELPLLAHIAIYTLNLIILRTVLDKNEFVFDESCYVSSEEIKDLDASGTRTWDKLAHIWRSWFPLESLNGLTAILSAKREGKKIILTGYKPFRIRPSDDRLETVLNVATTLADDITGSLAKLLVPNPEEDSWQGLSELEKRLQAENIDLRFELIVRRLRLHLSSSSGSNSNLQRLVLEGFREISSRRHRGTLIAEFFELVTKVFKLKQLSMSAEIEIKEFFIHPRQVLEMVEMRPEVAVEWLRLLREFGATHWIERYSEELLERIMYTRNFVEMRPEVAVEWLRLLRELGATHWVDRYGEKLLERIMHHRNFMEMRPEVAVEWLRLLRELGINPWIERYSEELLERIMHPRNFIEMCPEVAVEWLRLLRELGATHWVERYGEELIERIMHPRNFMEMRPEVAVEWLRLLRELGATHSVERYGEELIERIMHPRNFMEMRPEVAVEWLRLLRELGATHWIERYGEALIERIMYTRNFVEMRPEVAVEWLRLLRELGATHWIERYGEKLLERIMHPRNFVEIRPEVAVEWLRLLRELGATHWIERYGEKLLERSIRFNIGNIPLEYVQDIEWYARITNDSELIANLQSYTGSTKDHQ
ncbi:MULTISPECIES: NACHT domain-containing NTPase [Nostoc]|uniref:NACHT N-terminal Helical domain-containing protein n=1 Tax=Nostoc paludosum FACHB-159 TaxID=2692908 RepID=A0ABR8KN78_9NOSO|nr:MULTISPECIES: ATP-binding protein [Nostoc]MBD2683032.1 hypothetical protein [Nostoc sp. FACHB-857]MBD2739373.1 hypothetical protein [Nostoc paludosum FACHB-159]